MKWNHIMDSQPESNRSIVQINAPYPSPTQIDSIGKHYTMGQQNYGESGDFKSYIKWCDKNEMPHPNFWWVYAEDFPWPDKENT